MLLLAAERATLYLARAGRVVDALQFPAGDEGLAAFARYLAAAPSAPVAILVDVVEEEYRQDTIPHVFGRDRRAVLGRRFARQFRGTPYWLALAQGREAEGRRDDRVLLAALTRPELVTPWVSELLAQRVPISGIHSLPVLSRELLKQLGAKGQNVLLISVQQASGLRQTFFRDGQLKISRLAAMPRPGTVPYASYVSSELDKLRRYLNSLALTSRDGPLEIYVLSHGDMLAELEQECRDTDTELYRLVDVAELARKLKIPGEARTPYADVLFAQLLLDAPPREQYAQPDETRYYTLHRTRIGLLVAGVIMLLASTAYSTLSFVEALGLKQQALDAAQKADFYRDRFELARRGLPPTPVEPGDIKQAVDVVAALEARRATPLPWLAVLGAELAKAPGIRLDEVQWTVAADPNVVPGARADAEVPPEAYIAPAAAFMQYEIGILRGEITPFEGDWRAAIARIDALAAALRAHPRAVRVDVIAYPLDLESTSKVSGAANAAPEAQAARFALKLVLGVPDGIHAG
ncbi:MAG: hypothetical protein AB7I32_00485 [Gammaproteobacteria bacterium]